MPEFIIEEQEDLPGIKINFEEGLIEIFGKCLPEDTMAFFLPVEKQIRKYIEAPQPITTIILKLDYLNSSSQKRLLELISLFEDFSENGLEIIIDWYYKEDDEDIHEEGKDFARMLSLPIRFVTI